jgi:hypothetical protein
MANRLTIPPSGGGYNNDFSVPSRCGRVGGGSSYVKWNSEHGWVDRDGIDAPSPVLVLGTREFLRRWKGNVATDITELPLPDPEELNAEIPVSEWELGVDGKPRPPWAHTVEVCLFNPATAEKYTFASATAGAHIAFDLLNESVHTMRMLRGTRCVPLVNLTARPMKTKFKMSERPHFEIIGWRTLGGDADAIPAYSPAPQLAGPLTAATSAPAPDTEPPTPPSAKSDPVSSGPAQPQHQAKPKPPIDVTGETLAIMSDVKAVSSNEILNDDIPR